MPNRERAHPPPPVAGPTAVDVVCLLGQTPAVLTELLWALVQEGAQVERVTVITTLGALRYGSMERLFTKGRGGRAHATPGGKLEELFRLLDVEDPALQVACVPFEDVRDSRSIRKMGQAIFLLLRDARRPAIPLVTCISGGRKSMSAWGALAASLTGRDGDRLVHVTVSPELEDPARDFWFPERPADRHAVHVADIPFLRVSALVDDDASTVDALVREVTQSVEHAAVKIAVSRSEPRIAMAGLELEVKERVWALAAVYAEAAEAGARLVAFGEDRNAERSFKARHKAKDYLAVVSSARSELQKLGLQSYGTRGRDWFPKPRRDEAAVHVLPPVPIVWMA